MTKNHVFGVLVTFSYLSLLGLDQFFLASFACIVFGLIDSCRGPELYGPESNKSENRGRSVDQIQ